MKNPIISIIVPCYNQVEYLDECLQSVLDQTYRNWECIIVNDGSPDNTEEVAKKWLEKDSRFKYLYKENGGLSSARNAGIEIAKGEWILPLDSDDKIGNRYLELAEKEFGNGNRIIHCKGELFGFEKGLLNSSFVDKYKLLFNNPFFCSLIFPKKLWKSVNGYDEKMIYGYEDWELWINMIHNNEVEIVKLDYIGFFYRRKETSMNVLVIQNQAKDNQMKSYIIDKHRIHYANSFEQINNVYRENSNRQKKLQSIYQLIYKNFFGRLLYKILTIING